MAIWDSHLSETDRQVFARSGHGMRAGLGERPVVLVVDMNYAFCGDKDEPITESVKRWRNSCGHDAWVALPILRRLLDAARTKKLPIVYTTSGIRKDGWDRGAWGWKNRRASEGAVRNNINGNEIMPQIAPQPTDIVIEKLKPSAFFATPLISYLTQLRADSLIVTGTTTSGCVRATVIDGFSYNFRQAVVEDCCFDRYSLSHVANLFDMNAKYADVVSSDGVISYIQNLPDNLFGLPTGRTEGEPNTVAA
jgi:nicotinamidase-related amidase